MVTLLPTKPVNAYKEFTDCKTTTTGITLGPNIGANALKGVHDFTEGDDGQSKGTECIYR